MGHLDNAIRHSDEVDLPRLSILTDATTQKIAIKKWVAAENKCQVGGDDLDLFRACAHICRSYSCAGGLTWLLFMFMYVLCWLVFW